jgi:hypothetical protein
MTHWWKDFNLAIPSGTMGPWLPLTANQQEMPISGVLPSGEVGFFDFRQDRAVNPTPWSNGSGINSPFPFPNVNTIDEHKYPMNDFYSSFYAQYFASQFSDEWWAVSGILNTYGASEGNLVDDRRPKSGKGSIHPYGFQSPFSNAPASKVNSINDFTVFNSYIHHKRLPSTNVEGGVIAIPYVSSYRASIDWDAYGRDNGYNRDYKNSDKNDKEKEEN